MPISITAARTPLRFLLVVVTAMALQACTSTPSPTQPPTADFVFVTLKTGPKSASQTPEQSQRIFQGHMANMHRLAELGRLVVAGPFDKPHDKSWRGIFVIDVPTVDLARALVATDPGVMAEVFTPEFVPMHASPTLRQTLELERLQNAAAAASNVKPDPSLPPPNIRGYVMVTANDAAKARKAIAASTYSTKVVWCGTFDAPRRGAGVIILDADKTADVEAALSKLDPGPCSIDGWWSTTSLVKLPVEARQ
ncbi:MAG: YciI family protein [Planctomycetota bacterium]